MSLDVTGEYSCPFRADQDPGQTIARCCQTEEGTREEEKERKTKERRTDSKKITIP